jgi:hypothetical protein
MDLGAAFLAAAVVFLAGAAPAALGGRPGFFLVRVSSAVAAAVALVLGVFSEAGVLDAGTVMAFVGDLAAAFAVGVGLAAAFAAGLATDFLTGFSDFWLGMDTPRHTKNAKGKRRGKPGAGAMGPVLPIRKERSVGKMWGRSFGMQPLR